MVISTFYRSIWAHQMMEKEFSHTPPITMYANRMKDVEQFSNYKIVNGSIGSRSFKSFVFTSAN